MFSVAEDTEVSMIRPWQTAVLALLLILVFRPDLDALPIKKARSDPPPEPTPEELQATKKAFQDLGGWSSGGGLPLSKRLTPVYRMPRTTDDDLLKKLPEVRHECGLDLVNSQVTDIGLRELTRLKHLTSLNLMFTRVGDEGLAQIAQFDGLKILDLTSTMVTDAGLRHLGAMKRLSILRLDRTRVTDAGLNELAGLRNLWVVSMTLTQVTEAGVRDLRKVLPNCNIAR